MSEAAQRQDAAWPFPKRAQFGRRSGDRPPSTGMGWWPLVVLMVLSGFAATTALVSQQLTLSRAASAVPNEGFYWSVAQYQLAHHRLKQELRAVAVGEPANTDELSRRAAVLASRISILTEPSEVKSLLSGVAGYAKATRRIAELQAQVGPVLEKPEFAQADAIKVLGLFQAAGDEELLSQLASDVRHAEITAKDAMTQTLTRRIWWAWGGFALCWSALALWLFYAIRARRRYRAAAHDRKRAIESMEQAIASKRKFLSMVNHEVRSPLQSIVTSAELLAMTTSRPDGVAAIRRIRHAVTALQGQLRDLLTIAQGNAGQWPTQVESFELGELVKDVCADFEEAAAAKGLEFVVETPAVPLTLSADPIRIAQVLRNLVENAVRYTSAGQVRIRVEPFELDPEPGLANTAAGWVRFTVSDTGPGLPIPALERLKSSTVPFASTVDGSGIGLFVIRDLLEQLGGRIEVQMRSASDPDAHGTTISLTIPATKVLEVVGAGGNANGGAEPNHPLNILIVDDRADVRAALSDVTARLGHSCLAAASAAEARPLLVDTPFDAVLIDLEMPETNGRELAVELRQGGGINAGSMLILISAAENQAVGQHWPFDGFLQKPINGPALARLIGSRTSS